MQHLLTQPIVTCISSHLELPSEQVARMVAPPTRAGMGDFALPCFAFAKQAGVKPPELATTLAGVINGELEGYTATTAGPFLNIEMTPELVAQRVLPSLNTQPTAALRSNAGNQQTVCIDFSSPNIAKHLAFHHIRSTMIGNALSHLYDAAGWNVVRINFLGDWGTAFGRLIAGWKREGHTLGELEAAPDKVSFLNDLYVRISQAAKEDPAVMEEARHWSKQLEDGDSEARALWQEFKDASLTEFHKVYDLLGVTFDSWKGEAFYEDKMGPVIEELQSSGLLQEHEGAMVVDLSDRGLKKPCLIQRGDGGTLYATRDLTACQDRFEEFGFQRSLYVVDLGQSLHFKEWFAVADKLDKPYADCLRHVGFGVVVMWNEDQQSWGKTKTRDGAPLLLKNVLFESIDRARAIVEEKNPDLPADEKEAVARAVGVGAVAFNDLKNGRTGDVKFRFEDALAFQGETGPYLQYTHARLCSIERKLDDRGIDSTNADPALLTRPEEKAVLLSIAQQSRALERAVEEDEPSVVATALLDLASTTSSWLSTGGQDPQARVLCPDDATAGARGQLVRAIRSTLAEGLRLLGLQAPQRM